MKFLILLFVSFVIVKCDELNVTIDNNGNEDVFKIEYPTMKESSLEFTTISLSENDTLSDFEEIESCPFDNCSDNTSDIFRNRRSCQCDKDCIQMRDCCYDSEYYDRIEQLKPAFYTCQFIGREIFYVRTTCSSDWDDLEILEKCNSSINHDLNTEDIESRTPVTSNTTGRTYGNIFCAICNHDEDNVQTWDITIEDFCYIRKKNPHAQVVTLAIVLPNGSIVPADPKEMLHPDYAQLTDPSALEFDGERWYFIYHEKPYYCELTLKPPTNVNVKRCLKLDSPLIKSCPKNYTNNNISEQCDGPYSRIYDLHGKIYRNKYCAYCNGLTDRNLTCWRFEMSTKRLSSDIVHTIFGEQRAFTVLFDFKSKKKPLKICNDTNESLSKVQKQMCPKEDAVNGTTRYDNLFFSSYTSIAIFVSLIFLIMHLTIFYFVKELHTIAGKNLASFCVALTFAYGTFLAGNHVDGDVCSVVGIIMYYSFLSAFSWMLTISYDMWRMFWNATKKFRSPSNPKKTFFIYSIWSWSVPMIPVIITLCLDLADDDSFLAPHFGASGCWFGNGYSLLLFFVAPVFVIIVTNFVLFLHTAYMLYSSRCESVNQKSRVDFKLYARIGLLTGFTWITGFIAGLTQNMIVWFIFILLNTAQGVLIFTAFSFKKRIILSFLRRIGKCEKWQESLQDSRGKSDQTTTSTLLNSVSNSKNA